MPVLPNTLLNTLVERSTNATSQNATSKALHVVCAWPVSGQYGPGSRVLYYALVAVCVFARKAAWLRSACLAAALLFPAVAALHAIVLAAVHVNGAADMDVYGSFQLCSIGILAAPVTVRLSGTYLKAQGRNLIYIWTFLLLAGLLSLMVEFIRIDTKACLYDDSGKPLSTDLTKFPYGNITCGLPCYVGTGPYGPSPSSPLRQDSANNIYVIPQPDKLTFNTATLMAAGCCLPAILSLIFMWNKILEINWWKKKTDEDAEQRDNEFITGTNGATIGDMKGVDGYIRKFLSSVEIPVFGAAVLAILILGERNFFSRQVVYQTEPIASVGQWAPIVGTVLALVGSLYLLLSRDPKTVNEEQSLNAPEHHCTCSGHGERVGRSPASSRSGSTSGIPNGYITTTPTRASVVENEKEKEKEDEANKGFRLSVAHALESMVEYFGTAADDRFDDSQFRRSRADDFPEIPGEELRNENVRHIRETYNKVRDADGNVSRAGSPHSQRSRRSASPFSSPSSPRQAMTMPAERESCLEPLGRASSSGSRALGKRRDTLEVPSAVHHNPTRITTTTVSTNSSDDMARVQSSPTIMITPFFDAPSVTH
ncbi:hypothetical protein EG329_001690 [Mollisiaceae sp. DMI_Dod_QoI]|nr:hypothetical protein EG329_001690 [Helotiales sp. DMI_Dod_QoI]